MPQLREGARRCGCRWALGPGAAAGRCPGGPRGAQHLRFGACGANRQRADLSTSTSSALGTTALACCCCCRLSQHRVHVQCFSDTCRPLLQPQRMTDKFKNHSGPQPAPAISCCREKILPAILHIGRFRAGYLGADQLLLVLSADPALGDGELGRRGSDEERQVIFLEAGGQVPGAARAVGWVDDVQTKCASRRLLRNDRPGLGAFRVCYASSPKGMRGVRRGL